ncbi:MAG: cell division protein FtsW [Candidatus Fraserbacteria bacterium RBG_16_55_9]|uniref:Probable peptidoglycan glycosyltransferase FtsW n=1 Tax=Fraserbacteria sp. (strain RBG_16_55_9) TaxID=1817864 RepID=A0A1F5UNJ9_FRAXR|nr:MAG: cell division protein FtsW [Candidatus Fraserbacteria bacterium RBG_16_55_9]
MRGPHPWIENGSRMRHVERFEWGNRAMGSPDFSLMIIATALALFGLVMVASSSAPISYESYQRPEYLFVKQLIAAGVGFALLVFLVRVDYRKLFARDGILLLAALGLTLLTFVPALAPDGLWLRLGPISIQPTELTKLAFIIYMAASLVRKEEAGKLGEFSTGVLPFLSLFGFLALIALAQPDFALVVIYGAIVVFLLLMAGTRLMHLLAPLLVGLPLVTGLLLLAPYRRARLFTFLNPFADPSGAGYHLIQSLTALGSGGLFGRGLGAGREKWLYLPSAYNDFILSVIGEELGLIGAALVLGLFAYLAWRGFQIAFRAPDRFGFLLASGITFTLSFQAAINFGVAVGALPVTGLTLPFVSYGGSSLIISLAMIGILLNISRHSVAIPIEREGGAFEHLSRRWGNGRSSLPSPGSHRGSSPTIWQGRPDRLPGHGARTGSSGGSRLSWGGVL